MIRAIKAMMLDMEESKPIDTKCIRVLPADLPRHKLEQSTLGMKEQVVPHDPRAQDIDGLHISTGQSFSGTHQAHFTRLITYIS